MNTLYEHNDNIYINNTIYNKNDNFMNLFKKRAPKNYEPVDLYSSSSSDENENYLSTSLCSANLDDSYDEDFDNDYTHEYPLNMGGSMAEEVFEKKSKTKSFTKIKYLKIMPSFINVIKGRILYNKKSKFNIEPISPKDNKNVILGILIDLYKIDENLNDITIEKIDAFIKKFDIVPLLYNDSRNIVYKNKKTYFFTKNSKLAFITFKMPATYKYYKENIDLEPLSKLHDIDENKLTENSIIAHFIYENYYFLHTNPQKLKINECYIIDANSLEFKELNKIKNIEPNDKKLYIDDIYTILKKGKDLLKF